MSADDHFSTECLHQLSNIFVMLSLDRLAFGSQYRQVGLEKHVPDGEIVRLTGRHASVRPIPVLHLGTSDGIVFSLRSREGGADVSEIAKAYGGGGHRNASGFRVSFERFAKEFM